MLSLHHEKAFFSQATVINEKPCKKTSLKNRNSFHKNKSVQVLLLEMVVVQADQKSSDTQIEEVSLRRTIISIPRTVQRSSKFPFGDLDRWNKRVWGRAVKVVFRA